jgi:hypothetical protein
MEDVASWLKQVDFAQYKQNFAINHITGDLLTALKFEHMKDDLKILSLGHRIKLWREIENLVRPAKQQQAPEKQRNVPHK